MSRLVKSPRLSQDIRGSVINCLNSGSSVIGRTLSTMPSLEDVLVAARAKLEKGEKSEAARLIQMAAKAVADKNLNARAASLYEEAADIYRQAFMPQQCFDAMDNATLMLVRVSDAQSQNEIVRLNEKAGNIAGQTGDFKRAADFYFRASEFASTQEDKVRLSTSAAEALRDLAGIMEEKEDFSGAIALLKKVSGIYYSFGDHDLGKRMNERGAKLAMKWAEIAKHSGDFTSAGNALAEASQIRQAEGDVQEAPRLMIEAGEFYEAAGLFEKAGNIYDAAQESYKQQRLTSAYRIAMTKACEAYLKMEGTPEVVAPLLVKAGTMFTELGLGVKAKWAFKKAADLFKRLAEKAKQDGEADSERTYLRYRAMCLKRWGANEESEQIYRGVIDYHLGQASSKGAEDDNEASALSLEEAAAVLQEASHPQEANGHLEKALATYTRLAEKKTAAGEPDEASKFYSKAAEVASKLGDTNASASLHLTASKKAEEAAKQYGESQIAELETLWLRTAGMEALATGDAQMIRDAVVLLRRSAKGFKEMKELRDSFEDLFVIFTVMMEHFPKRKEEISQVIVEMDEIALTVRDEYMMHVLRVLKALEKHSHIAALMALQENETELASKREVLRKFIALVKS